MNPHEQLAGAIEAGDADLVQGLIARFPELVNSPDWTPPPLHCAVLWDQPRIAEMLLEHGADIEMRDPDRDTTPLRYAIMFAKLDLIQLFLARRANAGSIVRGGSTALQLAEAAAAGEFEQYDDLPSRDEYDAVVLLLKELGVPGAES